MRRCLFVLAVGVLAGAALLLPSAASAKTHSYWSTAHEQLHVHVRVADPANDITWSVLDHKIVVTTRDQVMVPFIYTCGTKADPKGVQYDPGAFQNGFNEAHAAAFIDEDNADFPTFTCDGTQHITNVVLNGAADSFGFENGTIEIGLVKPRDVPADPKFEHAVVGYDQLRDNRASVDVSTNVAAGFVKPSSKVTVKGTIKRDGKAYKGKAATLYFQSKTGEPATIIGSAKSDAKGKLTTKVTVIDSGTYFWTTTSTSKTQAGASLGDYAAKPEK